MAEALGLVLLCGCRPAPRRLAVAILREAKLLARALSIHNPDNTPVIDVMDKYVTSLYQSFPLISVVGMCVNVGKLDYQKIGISQYDDCEQCGEQ